MLEDHPIQYLLLHNVVIPLQLRQSVRLCARNAPLARRRRILVSTFPFDPDALQDRALRKWHELDSVVRKAEVEHPETRAAALVRGRLHDAVDGRFVEPAGEHLHGVAYIDNLRGH